VLGVGNPLIKQSVTLLNLHNKKNKGLILIWLPTRLETAGGSRTPDIPYLVSEAADATTVSISNLHASWQAYYELDLFVEQ